MYSLIVPIYKNEPTLIELISTLEVLNKSLNNGLEVILVIDGSPDRSFEILKARLNDVSFKSRLLLLSKNFGSFAAARAGLENATGPYYAVMAADLQEPPDLVVQFFERLRHGECDVVVGTRKSRSDPFLSRIFSNLFWFFYRKFVQPQVPVGGVDVFACNKIFIQHLLALKESNTTLIGLIFWLGFRIEFINYDRRPRMHGRSAWTFSKRLKYLLDSIFAFSDLPIRLLLFMGSVILFLSIVLSLLVLIGRISGSINVPGYATTVITITFFGGLNSFGLGIIGSYIWRTFENTKKRPEYSIMSQVSFSGIAKDV